MQKKLLLSPYAWSANWVNDIRLSGPSPTGQCPIHNISKISFAILHICSSEPISVFGARLKGHQDSSAGLLRVISRLITLVCACPDKYLFRPFRHFPRVLLDFEGIRVRICAARRRFKAYRRHFPFRNSSERARHAGCRKHSEQFGRFVVRFLSSNSPAMGVGEQSLADCADSAGLRYRAGEILVGLGRCVPLRGFNTGWRMNQSL